MTFTKQIKWTHSFVVSWGPGQFEGVWIAALRVANPAISGFSPDADLVVLVGEMLVATATRPEVEGSHLSCSSCIILQTPCGRKSPGVAGDLSHQHLPGPGRAASENRVEDGVVGCLSSGVNVDVLAGVDPTDLGQSLPSTAWRLRQLVRSDLLQPGLT